MPGNITGRSIPIVIYAFVSKIPILPPEINLSKATFQFLSEGIFAEIQAFGLTIQACNCFRVGHYRGGHFCCCSLSSSAPYNNRTLHSDNANRRAGVHYGKSPYILHYAWGDSSAHVQSYVSRHDSVCSFPPRP